MKRKVNERRVININKTDFDRIKKYCEENALDMPKWIVKIALEKFVTNSNKTFNGEVGEDMGNGRSVIEKFFVDIDTIIQIRKTHGETAAINAWMEMYNKTKETTTK